MVLFYTRVSGVKIMVPQRYGWQHILYLAIFLSISITGLIFAKKYAKTEKAKTWVVKGLAIALLVAIVSNRISIVFKTPVPEYKWLIPDSFCGLSSLVLSLAVLIGKKDNNVLHFVWLVSLAGGGITTFYPDFLGQNPSFMYLPTITGLLHHSLSALVAVSLFVFDYITLTYKKWYCVVFGFTCLITFGCFLIYVLPFHDAYSIINPVMSGTPFTVWVIAPIFFALYSTIILVVELIRKWKSKAIKQTPQPEK